jgi:hypothetical protein
MSRLAGSPGGEASSVLTNTIRSTPIANIDCSTATMLAESSADRSWLVAVTPRVVSTPVAPHNASASADRSAREVTTATREPGELHRSAPAVSG